MKVLITGATGLVGKQLVQLLLSKGVSVNYLTTSKGKIQDKQHYRGFYWNPEKDVIDEKCLDGADCIIHLAGASISKRWTKAYKQEILDSRIQSANVLYRMLKTHPHNVVQFITASAIGIYPDSLGDVYYEDDARVDDSFLGEVVQKWEAAAKQIEQRGIKVAILRTGIVLSGEGGALVEMARPVRLGVGSAFGSGKQMQSWIHIDDLVDIYQHVYINGLEGVYNAVAPNPVTNDTLMHAIAGVLGKPYFMPKVPKFAMAAILGEMHMLLFSSQNVSANKILDTGFKFKYLSLKTALEEALK